MNYIIGTRGSKLALWQAEYVCHTLSEAYPEHSFSLQIIKTKGDLVQNVPLNQIGEKGLFCKEIEQAILDGTVHLGVHSMKDMPSKAPGGLVFSKMWKRADQRDALILRTASSLSQLPAGAVIGTGSRRRKLQLQKLCPSLVTVDIRGNVDTRLRKMEEQKLDGIVLAAAGLKRLGMEDRITQYLSYDEIIPAPAQGILALEVREDDTQLLEMLNALADRETTLCGTAERAFLTEIEGDCSVPVGAVCERSGDQLRLRAVFGHAEHDRLCFADVTGTDPVALAEEAAYQIRRQMAGTVYLVGGGPGDPELITAKGLRLIREADCLVYDRLSSPELLRYAKPDCEMIYVGKQNRYHSMKQGDINLLLVKKSLQHKTVVRLKGGDVYVFGRGGEEGETLWRKGVPFETVSGVTSAIAGLAQAGIPITHRGIATGFRVFTAHNKDDRLTDLDFASLSSTEDTCVFLMGLSKLSEIVEKLLEAGKSSTTPAAVISSATTSRQATCVGTLADIVEKTEADPKIVSPALIVVGNVIKMREMLNWFETKPLFGKKLLVPRIENRKNSTIATALSQLGAAVTEVVVGKIQLIPHSFTRDELKQAQWVLFTSRNGVDGFFTALHASGLDARAMADLKCIVIGTETKKALAQWHVNADLMPEQFDSSSLTRLLQDHIPQGDSILYPQAEGVVNDLHTKLRGHCSILSLPIYRNVESMDDQVSTEELKAFDGTVFTCASSAQRTVKLFSQLKLSPKELGQIYSIGPKCSQALQQLEIDDFVQAKRSTYQGLIDVIKDQFS